MGRSCLTLKTTNGVSDRSVIGAKSLFLVCQDQGKTEQQVRMARSAHTKCELQQKAPPEPDYEFIYLRIWCSD